MISLFCKHEWTTHAKEKYEWTEKTIVKGTEHWLCPKFENIEYSETIEILICKKCSKIKKIKY